MTTIQTNVPVQVVIQVRNSTDRIIVTQMGPSGSGGGGAAQNVFVQPDPPTSPPDTYLWVETGLGPGGTDMTFWVEDGQ